MDFIEIHKSFINELLQDIDDNWKSIEIKFEHYVLNDELFEVYMAKYYKGTEKYEFSLGPESRGVLKNFKKEMALLGKDEWSWCIFTMKIDGTYNFEFKYGLPPLVKEMVEARR